jgi:hypothetical protein
VLLYDIGAVVTSTGLVYDGPVEIYPNPFSDVLSINFPQADLKTIELFDPSGRRVSTAGPLQGLQQTTLSIGRILPAGNYLLRLTAADGRVLATTISKK